MTPTTPNFSIVLIKEAIKEVRRTKGTLHYRFGFEIWKGDEVLLRVRGCRVCEGYINPPATYVHGGRWIPVVDLGAPLYRALIQALEKSTVFQEARQRGVVDGLVAVEDHPTFKRLLEAA